MNFRRLIRRTACRVRRIFLLGTTVALLSTVLLSGCVRVAGAAGYWHAHEEGESIAQRVGFDTADLDPDHPTAAKITI